ncbi:MAG: hypothetical protein KKA68_21235 [Gammaproteobacteria bacterium]|nr:hypothetical protein [Gammaproteobacteria bacterium]
MSEASVRAAIYAIVNAVSNAGNVWDYERWAAFAAGKDTIASKTISGSKVIRFWTVSCERIDQEQVTFSGDIKRAYHFVISGAFGLDDSAASEKTAIALTEDVMEALDGAATIHNATDFTDGINTASQLRVFELRLIGTEFCHYSEISQIVTEVV